MKSLLGTLAGIAIVLGLWFGVTQPWAKSTTTSSQNSVGTQISSGLSDAASP